MSTSTFSCTGTCHEYIQAIHQDLSTDGDITSSTSGHANVVTTSRCRAHVVTQVRYHHQSMDQWSVGLCR